MLRNRLSATSIRRASAALVGLAGLTLAAHYPLGAAWGVAGYLASAALVHFTTDLWIGAIPVALVVGDLYPWTGSLLVTESDLFLLAMLAVLLWRSETDTPLFPKHKQTWVIWLPLAVAIGVSVVRGWHSLPPGSPSDALSIYGNQWNALRVAKGFAWGFILAQLLSAALERRSDRLQAFSLGMQTSALLVAGFVILERAMAVGVFDFQHLYRATGPFFSMHTGGQHIDAYWALALPFLFLSAALAGWLGWLLRAIVLVLSLYAVVATMSRGVIVLAGFMIVALAFLTVVYAGKMPRRGQSYLFGAAAVLLVVFAGITLVGSGPIKSRFAGSEGDLRIRWNQWSDLCLAANDDWATRAFGNGLGTVPGIASNAFGHPIRQAELIYLPEGRVALRLHPGKAVYIEQAVNRHAPGSWTLTGQVRRGTDIVLNSHICEKSLFDSFRCLESSFFVPGQPGTWQPISWTVEIDKLSTENNSWLGCPMTFALSASGGEGAVDIADIHLTDARGASLLWNSDFQAGSSFWFFTSDDHSAWRAENMWVQLYLEMGWLGLASVAGLLLGTLVPLAYRASVDRDVASWVLTLSIAGFLMIGLFGSLVDTPWLIELLCAVLGASQGRCRSLLLPMDAVGDRRSR